MSEFIKPALPDRLKKKQPQPKPVEPVKGAERLVLRAEMPNTPEFWSDLMVGNSAFKSYNVSLEF